MAFFDKLNDLATTASEKATSALETGKLNLRISSEEKKITETTRQLGICLLEKLDDGQTFDGDIMTLYATITGSREAIAQIREELSGNNPVCTACGTENPAGSKFCRACGAKIEPPPPPPVGSVCPVCGTPVEEETKFCSHCGAQIIVSISETTSSTETPPTESAPEETKEED